MVQQGAERPALAGLVREAVEFPSRRREQLPERALQFAMRRRERRVPMIGIETGAVLFQPRPVQPVKPRDAPGPAPLPLRQRLVAGRALDEIPSRVDPNMLHSTYLGICCGPDYVAESRHRRTGHEDPRFVRNIIF